MHTLDIQEYIEKRVNNQIDWYDGKSQEAQNWYKTLQVIEIILASLIPLLSAYSTSCRSIAVTVGIFGAVIAIIESISKLNKYHENWIQVPYTPFFYFLPWIRKSSIFKGLRILQL